MWRLGRLLGAVVALLGIAAVPAAARAGLWARTEKGTKAFALLSPSEQQVVVQSSDVQLRMQLASGVALKAVIAPGYDTKQLTDQLRQAERPIGGGARKVTAVLGRLKQGPNPLTFVTTLGRETASKQVVVNRVLRAHVIEGFGVIGVGAGNAPAVRLVPRLERVAVQATLNGRDLSRLFARGKPLVRAVVLAPRLGLRLGANHLRVFVRSFKGAYEARSISFWVSPRRPLADAGASRRVRVGSYAVLDGSSSLRPAGAARGTMRYVWKIVSKPRGAKPRLFRAHSVRAVLRTDRSRPGRYTVRLTVYYGRPGKHKTDSAGLTASPVGLATTSVEADPQPRVPVDTFASEGGQGGIAVGVQPGCTDPTESSSQPCFYANPGTAGELQVLVLDRTTLAPPSNYPNYNQAYSTSDLSGFASQMQALATAQSGETCPSYSSDVIVIVALRSGSISDTANFQLGMSVFNVNPSAPDATSSSQCTENTSLGSGPFSVIAVPGTVAGKAWTNDQLTIDNPQGLVEQPGEIVGFLKEGSDDPGASPLTLSYGFTFPDSVFYDTRAGSSGNEVELGPTSSGQPYGNTPVALSTPGSGQGAIDVLSFDTVNTQNTLHLEATVGNTGSNSGLNWVSSAPSCRT